MARIRHIVFIANDPGRLAKFYTNVFGLTVTDGYVDMALLQKRPKSLPKGINHFGFIIQEAAKGGSTASSVISASIFSNLVSTTTVPSSKTGRSISRATASI